MDNPRFYCPTPLTPGTSIGLPSTVARHAVRVLRLQTGDTLTLFNGDGHECTAHITTIAREQIAADVVTRTAVNRESPLSITLLQALQAGEKMDWTIQKAVELGVTRIAPLSAQRSVMRLTGERAQRRVEHWRAIAAAACEQCGRNRVPEIAEIETLTHRLTQTTTPATLRLMPSLTAAQNLMDLTPTADTPIELLIGAEGGLAPEEMALAEQAGFIPVRLGPRVLRTETAGPAVLAAIQCLWGDWRV